MRRFLYNDTGFETAFAAFLEERRGSAPDVDSAVAAVLAAVKAEGLAAVLRYTALFDKIELTEQTIRVTAEEIAAGAAACPPDAREAIAMAARRIRAYHTRQRPADQAWTDEDGVQLGWRWTALKSSCCPPRGCVASARKRTGKSW